MKTCKKCSISKNLSEFYKRQARCKECHDSSCLAYQNNKYKDPAYRASKIAYRKANPEISLRVRCNNVGITLEYYYSLEKKCSFSHCDAIVPGGRGDWHLDHDHVTGKFRGLLCYRHNLLLGYARDNKEELQDAISYLSRVSK